MAYILAVIRHHPTACAFDAKRGDPIAWAALHLDGGLNFIYSVPKYRDRGLPVPFIK